MSTVPVPASPSTAVAVPSGGAIVGLEDVEATDLVMPRISIDHRELCFKDNLSGREFTEFEAVILGLVKQRILWDADVDEGEMPLCKSVNNDDGYPDFERFPWEKSGFTREDVPGETLPCASCNLKEWKTDPSGRKPWCTQQHTYPLLMQVGDGGLAPALFTVQRTGLTPSNAYLTSFKHAGMAMYTVWTKISLSAQKKGSVTYGVPQFVRGEDTDAAFWAEYGMQYQQIRSFISTPAVRSNDDDEGTPVAAPTSPAAAPAAAVTDPAAAPATSVPTPSPGAPASDSDLPWDEEPF